MEFDKRDSLALIWYVAIPGYTVHADLIDNYHRVLQKAVIIFNYPSADARFNFHAGMNPAELADVKDMTDLKHQAILAVIKENRSKIALDNTG